MIVLGFFSLIGILFPVLAVKKGKKISPLMAPFVGLSVALAIVVVLETMVFGTTGNFFNPDILFGTGIIILGMGGALLSAMMGFKSLID